MSPNSDILVKGVFNPRLLNNPLASCSLTNLEFLLSDTAHFDKSINLPLFFFATVEFLLSVFYLHIKQ